LRKREEVFFTLKESKKTFFSIRAQALVASEAIHRTKKKQLLFRGTKDSAYTKAWLCQVFFM
jgi:hypothetical protein